MLVLNTLSYTYTQRKQIDNKNNRKALTKRNKDV